MKADYYRNKQLLGELTFGDIADNARLEGDFSFGKSWLPMTLVKFSRSRSRVSIFMSSMEEDDPDVSIPMDAKVRVEGGVIHVKVGWDHVKIRLDRLPDWVL